MKRIALLFALALFLAGQARAAELPADLTDSVPQAAAQVAGADCQQGISSLLETVGESFSSLLRQGAAGGGACRRAKKIRQTPVFV